MSRVSVAWQDESECLTSDSRIDFLVVVTGVVLWDGRGESEYGRR